MQDFLHLVDATDTLKDSSGPCCPFLREVCENEDVHLNAQ